MTSITSMTMLPITALHDNYIWAIVHLERRQVMVVDPGDAIPVLNALKSHEMTLTGILITHHHWDHTNGVQALLDTADVPVYGPSTFDATTHPVKDGDIIPLTPLDCEFKVLEIPGHTLDHLAYFGQGAVFCGDTLFTAGCGRVFEGTFPQMYQSIQKLAALPADTYIYCGHEYTQANLSFAQIVEPRNVDIQKRIIETKTIRAKGKPTVPAPLSLEFKTNPFLRCKENTVRDAASTHAEKTLVNPIEIFTEIRLWKDCV